MWKHFYWPKDTVILEKQTLDTIFQLLSQQDACEIHRIELSDCSGVYESGCML
jgi:hypothetical protein